MRGDGNGRFTIHTLIDLYPREVLSGIAVGDLDSDGNADLIFAVMSRNLIAVALGMGDFGFMPQREYSTGMFYPRDMAIGDFNGDWIPDVVVTNYYGDYVSLLLGNGDGSLDEYNCCHFVGANPRSLALGDFNSDGNQDIAVAINSTDFNLSISQGLGDGEFLHATGLFGGLWGNNSIVAEDFNADGYLDLAVSSLEGTLTLLLNDGRGGLTQRSPRIAVGEYLQQPITTDLNGDGLPDVVVPDRLSDKVAILLNQDGELRRPPQRIEVGSHPSAVAVGDFNEDGFPDLVIANFSSGFLTLLLQQ